MDAAKYLSSEFKLDYIKSLTFPVLRTWQAGRTSNAKRLYFRQENSEVSTRSSQILRSGWKCSVGAFWGEQIYCYCNFHILPKVQRKSGHKRQEAQKCNSLYIRMTLKGFLKQVWKVMYLLIEHCFRTPSGKRQVTCNWGRHVTFHRTYWWCSRAFCSMMAHSSVMQARLS